MCRGAGIATGLRIDCLHEVTGVAESLLKPVPDSIPEHLQGYVSALLNFSGWTIAVLDLDALLGSWQEQCVMAWYCSWSSRHYCLSWRLSMSGRYPGCWSRAST